MARGKKKEELTLEEKLERALVPVEEQPYEVPGNWCWVTFDNIASIKRGASPRPIKAYVTDGEGVNWIKIGDSDSGKYINTIKERITFEGANKSVYVKSGSLLLSNSMSFGHPYILNVDGCIHDGWLAIAPLEIVDKDFLYYGLLASDWYFEQVAVGTAVRNLNSKRVADLPIAIPPYLEQRQIVEQIESLFAKLDEAKEKVQDVFDTFEDRKSAILYKAFQGELTKKWREKRHISILDWNQKTIKDVCNEIKVGIVIKPTQYYTEPDNGVAAFRSANVREAYIEDGNWVYINQMGQQENKRSEVHTGDVLVVRSGNPGTACVVTEEYDGFNAIDIIIAVPDKTQIDSKYLCYYTNSPEGKGLVRENERGMALSHFNVGGYAKLPIKIPSLEEQHEIVRIIEMEMSKEQKSKEIVQSVADEIDVMKKSILTKAFRGELGTNNPDEESAIELLKIILEET